MLSENRPLPNELLDKMLELRADVYQNGRNLYERWKPSIIQKEFRGSAKNLAYYLALRQKDLRGLQEELSTWGLSSLGRLESRTLSTIDAVIVTLAKVCGREKDIVKYPKKSSFFAGHHKLKQNSEIIFGEMPPGRNTAIMVTVGKEAAENNSLVRDLVEAGTNVLRINCAHDSPDIWAKIIANVRAAEESTGKTCRVLMDIAGPKARISWIMSGDRRDRAVVGKRLFLSKKEGANMDDDITLKMGCSLPQALDDLLPGESVLFDDGVIEGVVEEKFNDGVVVRINKTDKPNGIRLKADNGLNFPKSNLTLSVITEKDSKDLDFVSANADIVGFSFIKNAADIRQCLDEIQEHLAEDRPFPSVIAKIETLQGISNLSSIIAEAGGRCNFAVMVARGDLAVETGYSRLAELQQQILWLSEAADIPTIWATEVLDNMVKTGIPTRAEVTDAAEGGARSECIMLNRGSYVLDAVKFLAKLLVSMERNVYKKTPLLRALNIAKSIDMDD